MATLAKIHKEKIKEYGTANNTYRDMPVGTKVKVITPCCDFRFFYEETGVVTICKDSYLGITVKFDVPMEYEDGTVLEGFNFNPRDLTVLKNTGKELCPYCHKALKCKICHNQMKGK